MTTVTITSSESWQAPAGVTTATIQCQAGGGGGGGNYNNIGGGSGGGGGEFAQAVVALTPGNNYTVTIGAAGAAGNYSGTTGTNGGAGGNTSFGPDDNSLTVTAHGGGAGLAESGGDGQAGGAGGSGSSASTHYSGGAGGAGGGLSGNGDIGGGGGGGAGTGAAGGAGGTPTAGTAPSGGGQGGTGGSSAVGSAGTAPGGGGGGCGIRSTGGAGGAGARGQVIITYSAITSISQADSGSGSDASQSAAAISQAQTGTGADSLAAPVAAVPLADSGMGVGSLQVGGQGTFSDDSPAGSDAMAVTSAPQLAEYGNADDQGYDMVSGLFIGVQMAESGAGTDAIIGITLYMSDAGSSADALAGPAVDVLLPDSGIGLDVPWEYTDMAPASVFPYYMELPNVAETVINVGDQFQFLAPGSM
jgi:hypothetical protein